VFRLQAPHLVVEVGGEAVDVGTAAAAVSPAPGETTLRAVDAGDGSDLSPARDQLAVVRLPADPAERAAVTQRALDAGVALLAFVDPDRSYLTLNAVVPERWADVPSILATDESASRLEAAAAGGEDVTVTAAGSPYVYDIVTPDSASVDPEPVLDRAEQRDLATLRERFHRDPDGRGSVSDRRYALVNLMNLDSEGPLPERRTAHVSPDVEWQSMVIGPGFVRVFGELFPVDAVALSQDAGASYEAGSQTTVRWLRRPMWPGPVGGRRAAWGCQPTPVLRTPATMQVSLATFQDRRDGFGCADPHTSTLMLERDGTVIGTTANQPFAELEVPAEAGTYRLSYEQAGQGPYDHRSSTAWTFRSAAPGGDGGNQPIPLLVVDYQLPLDTLNRPDGRTATFVVDQVTGSESAPISRLRVWTSSDGGATWRRAPADSQGDGEFRVTLPQVDRGTPVSLRVDAEDESGNRIEQTLLDAYTG
jgi:hypothetical protein